MSARWLTFAGAVVALVITVATLPSAVAGGPTFSTLYKFEAPAATTFTSPLGSQPDTLPVLGPDGAIYGMTSVGGQYGNGVVYRFDPDTHQYTVLHTFSALNANGENTDGATPGMALTRGPNDVIYGMASFGGKNGTGTIFRFKPSGEFTLLYTFSALDATGLNQDGAYPLRAIVVDNEGNLYGTTRLGGPNTLPLHPWLRGRVEDRRQGQLQGYTSVHRRRRPRSVNAAGGRRAAIWLRGVAGYFPARRAFTLRDLVPDGDIGQDFQVLYTFSQTNSSGENMDGADCYEPLVEARPGVFYGAAFRGGTNGNGVMYRFPSGTQGRSRLSTTSAP